MRKPAAAEPAEFPRLVPLARLDGGETVYPITANAEERCLLARRFGLVALDGLTAEVRLSHGAAGIHLAARLMAEIVQLCGVTLEPFRSRIDDEFTLLYRKEAPAGDLVDAMAEDYEVLSGSEIDIGEAVAQQLSLALDPFPRAPGAEIPGLAEDSSGETEPDQASASPFAVLAGLAKK
jgi:uncharacterized metal-binding protein YceD (DUF177 family)